MQILPTTRIAAIHIFFVLLIIGFFYVLVACGPGTPTPTPPPDLSATQTSVVATIYYQLTQSAPTTTSTASPSIGFDATKTRIVQDVMTSIAATINAQASATPPPTPTPLASYTSEPTAEATQTPKVAPQPLVHSCPPLVLTQPDNNVTIKQEPAPLAWQWGRQLLPDEKFDIRISEGNKPTASAGLTTDTQFTYYPQTGETYRWTVVVIQTLNGQYVRDICAAADSRIFSWTEKGQGTSGGGGGNGGGGGGPNPPPQCDYPPCQ